MPWILDKLVLVGDIWVGKGFHLKQKMKWVLIAINKQEMYITEQWASCGDFPIVTNLQNHGASSLDQNSTYFFSHFWEDINKSY